MRFLSTLTLSLAIAAPAAAQDWRAVPDERVERTAEHYPETNERAHDVWYPIVAGRGGGYLGVGSIQSYSIAAAQGAERVVLVDYDPVVVRLHRSLRVLLAICAEVACLRARLEPDAEEPSAQTIARALGDGWENARTVRAFRVHRPLLSRQLGELGETESWVSRPDWYAHIHQLARDDRIIARTADLTGSVSMRAIGRAAHQDGLVFRVIYLSNAEEYFSYGEDFVQNLAGLPHDGETLVLRTLRARRLPRAAHDSMWHYDAQPLDDLLRRLRDHGYRDSTWIVSDLLASDSAHRADGSSVLDASSPALARAGNRRWWLESARLEPAAQSPRAASRLLTTYRRAVVRSLDRERRQRLLAIDLDGSGLSHVRDARLPADPRTGAPFVLSGEPAARTTSSVADPETNVQAMMLDAVARDVLPHLLERAGRASEARSLRDAPASADLYAAYRLRERLLEICPPGTRARGAEGQAIRACRDATRLVRPVPTSRARPSWEERASRIERALRSISHEAARSEEASEALVATLSRLAEVARGVR